jgi:hypothetical protein
MGSVIKAGGAAALIGFILGILSGIPLLKCLIWPLLCLGVFLLPVAAGLGYGYFAPGKESLQQSALGGALAGLAASIIYSLVTAVVAAASRAGVFVFLQDNNLIPGSRVGALELVLLSCVSIFLGLLFGALGGALWPVFQGNRA